MGVTVAMALAMRMRVALGLLAGRRGLGDGEGRAAIGAAGGRRRSRGGRGMGWEGFQGLGALRAWQAIGGHARIGKGRSEEDTSGIQSPCNLRCRLLLGKKKV